MNSGRNWAKVMEQYRASGLSGSEFCRQKNIPPSGFFYQQAQFRKKGLLPKANGQTKAPAKNSFIQVGQAPMIEIETKAGTILRVPTPVSGDELKQILGAIQ